MEPLASGLKEEPVAALDDDPWIESLRLSIQELQSKVPLPILMNLHR